MPFRVIRAAAPHMREPAKAEREQGEEVFRKIVSVTSVSGTMGLNVTGGSSGDVHLSGLPP